ncbi:hypothetical protein WJX77_002461 [Trebouxia sp. C0004]
MASMQSSEGVPSLLQICIRAVARNLLGRYEPELSKICEPEDARQIWNEYLRLCHTSGVTKLVPLGDQAANTFAKFWQPSHLKVSIEINHQLMPRLHLFGLTLTHLEFSAYWIRNLAWLQGTPNLQCLSLRHLRYLPPIQYRNLLAVPQLRSLDLFEMARSEEPTGFELGVVLAKLQNLKALNVTCTEVGDKLVETITFGRRLAAWSRETGQTMNAEQASWPQTSICQLRLSRTNITAATLGFLSSLQELQLLDIRKTGIEHSALLPLQKQFGLSRLVDGMLTSRNSLALAANQNRVACDCGTQEGTKPLDRWTNEGVTALLFWE